MQRGLKGGRGMKNSFIHSITAMELIKRDVDHIFSFHEETVFEKRAGYRHMSNRKENHHLIVLRCKICRIMYTSHVLFSFVCLVLPEVFFL